MSRLASMRYSIIGTSVAGSFVIAAPVTGYDTLGPIIIAPAAGAILVYISGMRSLFGTSCVC